MSVSGGVLLLETEDEAWERLDALVEGRAPWAVNVSAVRLGVWHDSLVYIKDVPINSSITSPLMEALVDYQKSLLRSYALLAYNTPDTRRIPPHIRRAILLHFVVEPGSSKIKEYAEPYINGVVDAMADTMTGEQWLYLTLGIALLYFSKDALTHWINARKEIKLKELDAKVKETELKARELDHMQHQFLSSQETERAKIFSAAIARIPQMAPVERQASQGIEALIRGATTAPRMRILDVDLSQREAEELLTKPRQEGRGRQIDGQFRVNTIDGRISDGHMFEFAPLDGGKPIEAEVVPVSVSAEELDLLWTASRQKRPVNVTLNAWVVGGRITRAFVMQVSEVT